jgi:hypothetical protein
MNLYSFTLSIPVQESWDVVVVGGGPCGCTAAAAAAREGARTLLIESSGMLGGSGTSALGPAWCPFSDKQKIIYRGLAERVLLECKAGMPHVDKAMLDWVPIDPERLKRIYDELVTSAGAQILFNTVHSAVEKGDGNNAEGEDGGIRDVSTLIVTNKSGLSSLRAKVYIDCTGDADVCAWAGAEFDQGEEGTGDLMPATHCFIIGNVDEYAFRNIYRNGGALHPGSPDTPIFKIIESGRYPLIPDGHLCANLIDPGTVGFNAGHLWKVDNTRPETVSDALVQGRKLAAQYAAALAEFCPRAFANSYLITTGSQMGIRETRRVRGDYILTLENYIARGSLQTKSAATAISSTFTKRLMMSPKTMRRSAKAFAIPSTMAPANHTESPTGA